MTTGLFTHAACLDHDPGPGHPESPDRLCAVLAALDGDAFAPLRRFEAPLADPAQLGRVHDRGYIDAVAAAIPARGRVALDRGDTVVSPGSLNAALRAAGAVCAAVDAVAEGRLANAFCAVRPPGHHAESGTAMGFCLFNNVAVGAAHARAAHGLERVAIIDIDVHHGNGTQHMVEDQAHSFYASTHQAPFYPGTGAASERGRFGTVLNHPLPAGTGSATFRQAISGSVLPALERFRPDFVMISAGFDAHFRDPLAGLRLSEADYAWATSELADLARRHCAGRLVSVLEGGYDLEALALCASAHVLALMAAGLNPT